MAKRIGCLVRYRSNGRVMRLAQVEWSPIGQLQSVKALTGCC